MRRRAFLATGLVTLTATAGCLDGGDGTADDAGTDDETGAAGGDAGTDDETEAAGGDAGTDDAEPEFQDPDFTVERNDALPGQAPDPADTTDGLAPDPEAVDQPGADVDDFEVYERYDEPVPLVPIDVAYDWYRRRDARFLDARSARGYENSHVTNAVLSPAPDARREPLDDDPVDAWSTDDRIVTYCACPHHLSGQRAAELRSEGYTAVFAIDEGYAEWVERGYPVTSGGSEQQLAAERTVSGQIGSAHAGEFVYVRDAASEQVEPGVVAEDGSFEVGFRFVDVGPRDELTVETPEWTRTAPSAELTEGTLR